MNFSDSKSKGKRKKDADTEGLKRWVGILRRKLGRNNSLDAEKTETPICSFIVSNSRNGEAQNIRLYFCFIKIFFSFF